MRTLRIRVDFTVNGGDPRSHTSKGRLSLITAPIGNFWEPVVRRGLDLTQRKAQVVGPGSVTGCGIKQLRLRLLLSLGH